jgi:hypothetical protein
MPLWSGCRVHSWRELQHMDMMIAGFRGAWLDFNYPHLALHVRGVRTLTWNCVNSPPYNVLEHQQLASRSIAPQQGLRYCILYCAAICMCLLNAALRIPWSIDKSMRRTIYRIARPTVYVAGDVAPFCCMPFLGTMAVPRAALHMLHWCEVLITFTKHIKCE